MLTMVEELWTAGGTAEALEAAVTAWRDAKVADGLVLHVLQQLLSRGLQRSGTLFQH